MKAPAGSYQQGILLRDQPDPVSYTHLDVYKRQVFPACKRLLILSTHWAALLMNCSAWR